MAPTDVLTVAFLTDAPRVAGSEVWLLEVLPRLRPHGIRPRVYLGPGEALTPLAGQLGDAGVPVTRYGALDALPDLTRDADVRVLQVWNPATYDVLLPALAPPRLVIVHDQLEYHYPLGLNRVYRAVYRRTKAAPQRTAERVITTSAWGEAFMRARLGLPDVGSVRNGVDARRFRPAGADDRARLRASLAFRRFTVLVPGRFAPEKNQLAAVRAARSAPELDFVFAGDMDSGVGTAARVLARALRLGNVRFLGRRWDMPDLYAAADALLQPTLAENQSLVTLEAMASGLPVVTTPIPAQAELIRDGVTGLLVPPRPALLAQALRALAAHPARARELGLTARQHVLHVHTLDDTARGVAAALRGLAGR